MGRPLFPTRANNLLFSFAVAAIVFLVSLVPPLFVIVAILAGLLWHNEREKKRSASHDDQPVVSTDLLNEKKTRVPHAGYAAQNTRASRIPVLDARFVEQNSRDERNKEWKLPSRLRRPRVRAE